MERLQSHSDDSDCDEVLDSVTDLVPAAVPRMSARDSEDQFLGVITGVNGMNGMNSVESQSATPRSTTPRAGAAATSSPSKSGMYRQRSSSNSTDGTQCNPSNGVHGINGINGINTTNTEQRSSVSHSNSQFSFKMFRTGSIKSQDTDREDSVKTPSGVRRLSISELRKRVQAKRERKKKKQGLVHKFLPVMLKMTILSTWCALSTVLIFGIMGGTYPTLSGVLDSLINGTCVYLSFGFTQRIYGILCLPILACKVCAEYVNVVKEADEMSRDPNYEQEQSVLG